MNTNKEIKSGIKDSDGRFFSVVKLIFLLIFSLVPLLGATAFAVWRVMKAKERPNDEIRDFLFKVHIITITAVLMIAAVISLIVTR